MSKESVCAAIVEKLLKKKADTSISDKVSLLLLNKAAESSEFSSLIASILYHKCSIGREKNCIAVGGGKGIRGCGRKTS